MVSCKRTAELISLSMEKRLSLWQRLALVVHLCGCRWCRRFRRQMRFLAQACRIWAQSDRTTEAVGDATLTAAHVNGSGAPSRWPTSKTLSENFVSSRAFERLRMVRTGEDWPSWSGYPFLNPRCNMAINESGPFFRWLGLVSVNDSSWAVAASPRSWFSPRSSASPGIGLAPAPKHSYGPCCVYSGIRNKWTCWSRISWLRIGLCWMPTTKRNRRRALTHGGAFMVVLSRKIGERILVPHCELNVTVIAVEGKMVRLGISAPADVDVFREEVWQNICRKKCSPPPNR